jgi:cytosine/adenosine deaminase-related metal-dependent hydrolase
MRKFTADFVFPVSSPPIPNGIVITDDEGKILEVASPDSPLKSPLSKERGSTDVQYHSGIIVPGFVNAHCHLELSHLKGAIPEKSGLDEFIMSIESLRATSEEEIISATEKADAAMYNEGIVAVGDISNKNHSFRTKARSKIHYHTFIELLGFHPSRAEHAFEKGMQLKREYEVQSTKYNEENNISLSMHAPYSASVPLLEKIKEYAEANNSVLTMHNQENADENLLFLNKTGKILKRLEVMGIDASFFEPTGKTSLLSTLPHLPAKNKIQLVHNVYTTGDEIDTAMNYNRNSYWCFCPNANLYIENQLPNIKMFYDKKLNITLGTDSLASNWQLSMLEEIKTVQKNFSAIPFEEILKWTTLNGAKLLGISEKYGSIEKGKQPGLVNIQGIDNNFQITSQTKAVRVI